MYIVQNIKQPRICIIGLGEGIHYHKNGRKRLHVITYLNSTKFYQRKALFVMSRKRHGVSNHPDLYGLSKSLLRLDTKKKAQLYQSDWIESTATKEQQCRKRLYVMPSSSSVQWVGTSLVSVIHDTMGLFTRYVKLRVAHAPGMPGTIIPPSTFKRNRLLMIPACIMTHAWRTCRDSCQDR